MSHYDTIVPKLCPSYDDALAEFSQRSKFSATLLELGTGSGNIAHAMLASNPCAHYFGVDLDLALLHLAKQKLTPYCTTLARDDFSTSKLPNVDTIVSSLSIHHLDPPAQEDLFTRIHSASTHFLHFEIIRADTHAQQRTYDNFVYAYVHEQAQALNLPQRLIQTLKEKSLADDKPLTLATHERIHTDLDARFDVIFQNHCFVFYEVRRKERLR